MKSAALLKKRKEKEKEILENFINMDAVGLEVQPHRKSGSKTLGELSSIKDQIIDSRGPLKEEVVDIINSVLEDHQTRLKVFLVSLSRAKIESLSKLSIDIDRMETELSSRNLSMMNNKQLLELYKVMSDREKMLADYVVGIANSSFPNSYEGQSSGGEIAKDAIERHGVDVPNVAARRSVVSLVDRITREIEKRNG